MIEVTWNLKGYLQRHGLTPYRLAKSIPDMRQATIYRLAAEDAPQSVSFEVLSKVLTGLRALTGESVTADDLILLREKPNAEDRAWMDADLSRLGEWEAYDWGGLNPLELGEPVHPVTQIAEEV